MDQGWTSVLGSVGLVASAFGPFLPPAVDILSNDEPVHRTKLRSVCVHKKCSFTPEALAHRGFPWDLENDGVARSKQSII